MHEICRNLFKKVANMMKTHQIPIEAFLAALKMMKVEDIDQVCSKLVFKSNSNKYYPPHTWNFWNFHGRFHGSDLCKCSEIDFLAEKILCQMA